MVRLRGRSSRTRGSRRGGLNRAVGGRGAVSRGGAMRGVRGARSRGVRGGAPFGGPMMGRPRPPAMQPVGFGDPEYGFLGPRMPPVIPPLPGPRAVMGRPFPSAHPHPAAPFPRPRHFPNEYAVRHPLGMPQVSPRPMLPPVPPFIRGRGAYRGGLAKAGKLYNNGLITKAKTNKKKTAKAKRNEEAETNKPWVNNALKVEIQKKHRLFEEANRKHSDSVCWKAYNDQKAFVANLVKSAKLDYIGSHSEEEVSKIPELKSLLEATKKETKSASEVAATA